jgi:hypothetical protein
MTPTLDLLAVRVEATKSEWQTHHAECSIDFCPESFELARHADDAARVFGFEHDRQARRAERRAAAV